MAEKKDGFFKNTSKFFKRIQSQDLIRVGDDNVTTFSAPMSKEENKRRTEFSIFRQYIQQKNWSTRHIELYNEYRRMDESFPIISAALKIYVQETCLSGDTIIKTPMGDLSILELYQKGKDKDIFFVQSYDKTWKRTEWNMAAYIKHNGKKELFEVEVEVITDEETKALDKKKRAFFKCTSNHKIMLEDNSFKKLEELKEGDEIFSLYKFVDPECNCLRDTFTKTKILSIKSIGEEDVYDLINVQPNNHFSIKVTDYMYVEVHNCTKGEDGNIIKIISEDKQIKDALEECFFKNLKINSQGYLLAKEMLKFGNVFAYLNVRKGVGVTDIVHLPPEAMRIELLSNATNLDDYKYNWIGNGGNNKFEPWEIVHFRNIEDIELQPYGTSILRSVVDTWRRIILMREALIIYRITRATQRYLFKIDTTGMDPDAALLYADEIKKQMYKKPLINPTTGELDFKYNPISIEENLYMPTFEGDSSNVEVLQGASNLNDVEDYKIIKEDLFAGLLIPKSFLTFEEGLCIRANTKIPTGDGIKTIKELCEEIERNKTKKRFILACNDQGFMTPGKVLWCKPTKEVTELYKIGISNGKFIECTNNHPFMLANLTYKAAEELVVGEVLKGILQKDYYVETIEKINLEEPEWVYDLEVEEHHNFATAAGVFIHNSNKAALKSEDLRFGNAVRQYQSYFIEGLLHIAVVHLHLQGFSSSDLEKFTIEMNVNSQELKKLESEVLQQKIDLAKSILDIGNGNLTLMSVTQVLKDVLEFTDEEIRLSFENQLLEKKIEWRLTKIKEDGFYVEPEENKKEEELKRLGSEDVFANIKFESKNINTSSIKSILSEKVKNEIKTLVESRRQKPSKKLISKIITSKTLNTEREKVLKDLGL